MHFTGDKNSTRFLESNILNLAYAEYEANNCLGIPQMQITDIPRELLEMTPIQGFNFALKTKNKGSIGCHFFLHDYQFERVWKYPDRYIDVLKKFRFVLSPDFSPYADMPEVLKMYNVYRNRWCGRWWQDNGITVIPTVTWSDEKSLEYCLEGIPKHSIIAVSTMGEGRWGKWKSLKSNWDRILDTLEPKCVILYGKDLSNELSGSIIHKNTINKKVAV